MRARAYAIRPYILLPQQILGRFWIVRVAEMDAVEEIKGRLSIDDVVGRYVDLKRSGANFKGLCPFHQEKTPSFYVTPSRGTFHCFGCDRGGDVFSFLMEYEKLSFPEALKQLAEEAGVRLPEREAPGPSLKKQLYEANEAAAALFAEMLRAPQGERARRYLEERRFDAKAIELFGVGYASDSRDELIRHLRKRGVQDRLLLAAGLVLQEEIGGGLRDRFRGRLMFPIRDAGGHITGFGARALADIQPKYLNSPQTEIFDKSAVLFGIHLAGDAIRSTGRAVLVEGYLDAVRAHREGFSNVVASLGTAVTAQQLTALTRLTETVIIALDPDPAGQSAAARAALTALAEVTRSKGHAPGSAGAVKLLVARLPKDAGDPDELIRDHPDRWQSLLHEAVPAFDYYFRQTIDGLDRTSEAWRQEAIDRLLPVIRQFASSTGWQAIWIGELARETGIDPGALERAMPAGRERLRRRAREEPGRDVVTGTTARGLAGDPALAIEQGLLALLLTIVVVPNAAAERLRDARLSRPEHQVLLDHLLGWRQRENYDYEMLRETLPEELQGLADELAHRAPPLPADGAISLAVEFYLTRLEHFRLIARLERVRQLVHDVAPEERSEAMETLGRLMQERHQIERDLERLSVEVARTGP